MGVGGFFCYAGIKGYSITGAIQAVIQGKSPATLSDVNAIGTPTGTGSGSSPSGGSAPAGQGAPAGTSAGQAQAYAQSQLAHYGWSGQMGDLINLWNKESGWSSTALNPSSGAYGIAQALPSSKYPAAGQPSAPDGTAKVKAQIDWGLQYIQGRYGSITAAWAHEVAKNWY